MHIEKDWVCVPCNSHCPQAIFLKGVKPPPLKTKQKPPIWGKNTNTNRPLSHCFSNVKVQALVRSIHDLVFHYVLFYPDILLQHFVWESLTAALFFSTTIRCFLDGIAKSNGTSTIAKSNGTCMTSLGEMQPQAMIEPLLCFTDARIPLFTSSVHIGKHLIQTFYNLVSSLHQTFFFQLPSYWHSM